jgi:FkbM family methyltransferase
MLDLLKLRGLADILVFDNWPMLLFGRLFDRKTGFVVYRKKGLDILIDHLGGDENGTRTCIASDMYRKYLPSFAVAGPANVLDLGANGGGFPLMLRIAGIEMASAVCVEMNPLTFLRLQVNLTTNLGSSAIAINAAVCGMPQDSNILLKPSRGSTGESIYTGRVDSNMSHVSVRTTTLQALCDQYFKNEVVDICKIDIEGAEYELFASSPDEAVQRIRYLIIEFHDSSKTPALIKRIAALGFVDITIEKGHETDSTTEVRAFLGPGARAVSSGSHLPS